MKLLSLVFSFRNEESNLNELMSRLNSSLKKISGWNFEYIFVNDDSDDNSEKILIELQKLYPIKIINLSRRFGVGPGILAGLKHSKGDALVYMDSDLQDPPELIPTLIEKFENGADVVHTKRTKRLGESRIKIFFTGIAYRIINITSSLSLPVEAGDFKLLSRKVVNHINSLIEYDPYVRGLSVWIGFKQDFVKYVRESRASGTTNFFTLRRLLSTQLTEFSRAITGFSTGPLYLGIFIGMLAIIFSIFLIVYALYLKLSGIAVAGTSGIIITISFFSGVILTTIGIIGVYVAKIFEQTQGRPRYIVKNIIEQKIEKMDKSNIQED